MARKLKQIKLGKNQGIYISVIDSTNKAIDQGEILFLGVQGVPGTWIGINNFKDKNIQIGYTGIYEVDFSTFSNAYVREIYVKPDHDEDILLDFIYAGSFTMESLTPDATTTTETENTEEQEGEGE